MKDAETVYLHLKDGLRVGGDEEDLKTVLETHPEIEHVVLFWTWSQDYYTSNASIFEAYVSESKLDDEYSFFGDREDALKFAESYDCWDGEEFLILNGNILYGYRAESDCQRSWNDGYDHVMGLSEGYDPTWFAWIRVYFDCKTSKEYLLSPDPLPKR